MDIVQPTDMRNSFYDNLKGLLCFLVVFGHLCEKVLVAGNMIKYVYMIIYSFHIPLFVFISGFFSQQQNYKKILSSLVYPYFVWQVIYFIFACWVPESALNTSIKTWLYPIWLLWYLVALIIWKLIIPFFDVQSNIKKIILVVLSFMVGVLVGYDPFASMVLSLQRVFVLFPYFLSGYYMGKTRDYKKRNVPVFLLAPLIPLSLIIVKYRHEFNTLWLFNSVPYNQIGEPWEIRLYLYLLSIFMMVFFYKIVTTKQSLFTTWGRNSMQIYLGHGIIVLILLKLNIFNYLVLKYNVFIILLIFFFLSTLICILLGNDFVRKVKFLWNFGK